MRPFRNWLVIALLSTLATPVVSYAVVVIPLDDSPPVAGYLVRQDANQVVVRVVRPDGKSRERTFRRDEIRDLLITVSTERLAALTPDQPQMYRDYAEELAEKRQDPEARDVALRLYLIATYLDPAQFARSSLLGMADLARHRAEESRFRALAYLLDPDHDRALLKPPTASMPVAVVGVEKAGRAGLTQALRHLRRGENEAARRVAERPAVKAAFGEVTETLSLEDFLAACTQAQVTPILLRRILQCELLISKAPAQPAPAKAPASDPASSRWFASAQRDGTAPLPDLSLERITEFDPRLCRFRDGRWEK